MIDLFTVKQNNTYDFVQDDLPASDGTWLCSLTSGAYTRGHSYSVADGVATREGEAQDRLINSSIPEVIENTLSYLNNTFYVARQSGASYTFDTYNDYYCHDMRATRDFKRYVSEMGLFTFVDGVVTGINDNSFIVGDLIMIKSAIRNNLVSYVTAQADGTITLDNEQVVNTTENAYMFLVNLPSDVKAAISKMVWWDVYQRNVTDMQQERVGNYSYAKEPVGGSQYPNEIVTGLNSYRKVRFVA